MTTTQNFDNIVTFGKENVDALVQSGTVAAKGMEELAKSYAALANKSIEQTTSAVKALTAAKSPTEFQSIYSNLLKSTMDSFVSESRKLQELFSSVVTDSAAPINARVQALSGLFHKAA